MSTAPITPWGDGATELVVTQAPAVQALQPLIDGASMASSPELNLLFGALAAAQGAMQNAEKNQQAKVGQGGTRLYADLAAVLAAVREPLQSQELAIIQLPLMDLSVTPPRLSVATVLGHSSGQWIGVRLDADAPTQAGMNDLQALGNAITYLRRYGVSAITGIAQQDTDGAQGNGAPADPRQLPAARGLRKRLDAVMGKLAPDSAADAEKAWQRAKTIGDLSKVAKRAEDLAKTPEAPPAAPPAPAPAAPPAPRTLPKPDHTPERSAKINRLMTALDKIQASDSAVAKCMATADAMSTADLERYVRRAEDRARESDTGDDVEAAADAGFDDRAEQQELGMGGAE